MNTAVPSGLTAPRPCRKKEPTKARLLTQHDYDERGGIVHTREGDAPFVVGDYLAVDAIGEYPIHAATIKASYEQVSEPDSDGFALYRSFKLRRARQVAAKTKTTTGLIAYPGDYIVYEGNKAWPVEQSQFEAAYEFVEE